MLAQTTPSPSVQLVDACGVNPGWACQRVFEATDNKALAGFVDWLIGGPLHVLLILVLAYVINRLIHRAIRRFTETLAGAESSNGRWHALRERAPLIPSESSPRAASRARTLGSVLGSISTAVVYTIAGATILGELGINLGPLIASAGIAGVAFGFGAQSLVKDFLTGMFMLVEDQYGVGDVVDVGEATGTVEAVGLRTTRLRSVDGTVWHVPNGQINRVGNKSQEWSRALLDVTVAYTTDVRQAETTIKQVADRLWDEDEWRTKLLEEPEVWGVERLGANGVDIRVVIKTQPSVQFAVSRELRTRIKEAFDEQGIQMTSPQMVMQQGAEVAVPPAPAAGPTATAGSSVGEGDVDG